MQWKCLPKAIYRLARYDLKEMSPKARERLRALETWEATGDAVLAARLFGMSLATLYRWRRRFKPQSLTSLEDRSRRPRRVRRPSWPSDLVLAVERLRTRFPRWGKEPLARLLWSEGFHVSVSTVGRILGDLRRRGVLKEPRIRPISARKRKTARYASRKPSSYGAVEPGDLVQLDTMDIRPMPGVVLKAFGARDVVSRVDVFEVYRSATSHNASLFLHTVLTRLPFTVRAFQIDGGSEFKGHFEQACKKNGIPLFVLPPRSPKLNAHIERANRTHTEEFFELYEGDWTLEALNSALLHHEYIYNTIRPHLSLGYLTPYQFLHTKGILTPRASPPLSQM